MQSWDGERLPDVELPSGIALFCTICTIVCAYFFRSAAATKTARSAAAAALPYLFGRASNRASYGIRIDEPVVWRDSRSWCDLAASLSA